MVSEPFSDSLKDSPKDALKDALRESAYRVRTSRMHAVLDILGDPWNLSILRQALAGVQRFDAFVECLGVSRPALSKRLDVLVDAGCLRKTLYCTHPPRYQYDITPMGQGVKPLLQLLQQWNERWHIGQVVAPPVCSRCALAQRLLVVCAHCRQPLEARQVKPLFYEPLPAEMPAMPAYRRTRHQVASKERELAPVDIPAENWLQDRWSALILGGMMMGLQRYGDFLTVLGIAPNILSGRLEALTDGGLIERLDDGRYRLGERGLALYPTIMAMRDWGEQWLHPELPLEKGWGLLHKPCGEWLKLDYICAHCGHAQGQ